jgi:hypothetical protein
MSVDADHDGGRVSVFLAIAFTGLLAIIGVAVDGSGQLRTLMRADNLAAEAARAAGQAVDTTALMRGDGAPSVLPDRAADHAARYLAEIGHDLPDHSWSVVPGAIPGTVDIQVRLVYHPRVLGLFGLTGREVTAEATAVLVTGPS